MQSPLTLAELEHIFDEYVFGMMRRDIEREISLADTAIGGSNVLAAIGLFSFTEFLGFLVQRTGVSANGPLPKLANNEARFMEGLYRLGAPYREMHRAGGDPWALRNDLLHTYATDQKMVHVYMKDRTHAAPGLIWRAKDGEWDVIVESYLRDFVVAAGELRAQIRGVRKA